LFVLLVQGQAEQGGDSARGRVQGECGLVEKPQCVCLPVLTGWLNRKETEGQKRRRKGSKMKQCVFVLMVFGSQVACSFGFAAQMIDPCPAVAIQCIAEGAEESCRRL
jgi:hypothetical protein